jgi:magnesium chelatase family protein
MFLDELPEFDRRVLEVLREPLESGRIVISRAARQAEYPARFQLIAAMNPCPCGYLGHQNGRCHCSADQVRRYRARLSGPLLDRIDMHIEVPSVSLEDIQHRKQDSCEESSQQVRQRVVSAHQRQQQRQGCANSRLQGRLLEEHCPLQQEDGRLLSQAIERLGLSARAYHRILKLARTIADLAESDAIKTQHISEALTYRRLDRA